jgi:putative serine protease PepD
MELSGTRVWGWTLALCLAGAIPGVLAQQTVAPGGMPEPADLRRDPTVLAVERVMPAVVNVEGSADIDPNNESDRFMSEYFGWRLRQVQEAVVSRGSGVVIDEEGYVLTNVHVVDGVKRVFVKFNDGSEPIEAERVALNAAKDVALLRLKSPGRKFPAVKFAKDDDLLLGETVIALGNPFGYAGSVSRGILSSRARRGPNEDRSRGELDTLDWIQTDAAINPGNSGGPLVDGNGAVIGVNSAIAAMGGSLGGQAGNIGLGFAIPIDTAARIAAELIASGSSATPIIGVQLDMEYTGPGARVAGITDDGPAQAAGLREGDVITALDGTPVVDATDLIVDVRSLAPGEQVTLTVESDGSQREVTRILGAQRS